MPISKEHTLHPKVAYSDTRRKASGFRQKGKRLSLIVRQNKKKKPQEKKEDWADDVIKIFTSLRWGITEAVSSDFS